MHNTCGLARARRTESDELTEMVSDDALIASIARRNRRAMEVLFARHSVRIYRFSSRLTANADLAEDVVSEVFLEVWRGAERFRASSQVSTWLFAIARHKAISARNRCRDLHMDDETAAGLVDTADDPETSFHHNSRSALLRKCLMQLPPNQREVLDLVYYHGKTVAEVSEIVGIPAGTVKTRMMRARNRMAQLLKGAGVCGLHAV